MAGCSSNDCYLLIVLYKVLYYVISDYIILSSTPEERICIPSLQIPECLNSFKGAYLSTFIVLIKNK